MLLVTISVFLLTVLLLNQIVYLITRRNRKLSRRLNLTLGKPAYQFVEIKKVAKVGKLTTWLQSLSLLGMVTSRRYRKKIQQDLTTAGIPLSSEEMVSLNIITTVVLLVLSIVLFRSLFIAAVLGILGFLAPIITVKVVKARRANKIEGQLLDTLVLMANSLRAGNSFMQSLELASRETPAPLGTEFSQVIKETRLGNSLEQSLKELISRMDCKEMELVVTGVLIQRQVGGNLAEVLDIMAETIEKRIKTKAKIKTLTAQGRLSAWVISLLPIGLAAFIFGAYPNFGKIMLEEPIGIAMLSVGTMMMVIGIIVIRKVVNIDV